MNTQDTLQTVLQHVHDFVFTMGARPIVDEYFIFFTLDDGKRQIIMCDYASEERQRGIEDYAERLLTSLDKRKIVGFAMAACLPSESGLAEYWCLASDNALQAQAQRFFPFTNEDGVLDYVPVEANPIDNATELEPMVIASSSVWQLAIKHDKTDLDLDVERLERLEHATV